MEMPVYIFLTGDDSRPISTSPDRPNSASCMRPIAVPRPRPVSITAAPREELDHKLRSLHLKLGRVEGQLQRIYRQVVVTGRGLGRRILAAIVGAVAALGTIGYVGWREHHEQLAPAREREQQERAEQDRERIAAEAARKEAATGPRCRARRR